MLANERSMQNKMLIRIATLLLLEPLRREILRLGLLQLLMFGWYLLDVKNLGRLELWLDLGYLRFGLHLSGLTREFI